MWSRFFNPFNCDTNKEQQPLLINQDNKPTPPASTASTWNNFFTCNKKTQNPLSGTPSASYWSWFENIAIKSQLFDNSIRCSITNAIAMSQLITKFSNWNTFLFGIAWQASIIGIPVSTTLSFIDAYCHQCISESLKANESGGATSSQLSSDKKNAIALLHWLSAIMDSEASFIFFTEAIGISKLDPKLQALIYAMTLIYSGLATAQDGYFNAKNAMENQNNSDKPVSSYSTWFQMLAIKFQYFDNLARYPILNAIATSQLITKFSGWNTFLFGIAWQASIIGIPVSILLGAIDAYCHNRISHTLNNRDHKNNKLDIHDIEANSPKLSIKQNSFALLHWASAIMEYETNFIFFAEALGISKSKLAAQIPAYLSTLAYSSLVTAQDGYLNARNAMKDQSENEITEKRMGINR